MSKTKGNSVDPLDVVDEIGADALRFALVNGSAPGSDQRLTQAKASTAAATSRTSCGTPGARFVSMNRPEGRADGAVEAPPSLAVPRWIRSRVGGATGVRDATARCPRPRRLRGHRVRRRMERLLRLVPEMAKVDLRREDASEDDRAATWTAAASGLATLLRLLHLLMPFVTEEIWQAPARRGSRPRAPEPLLVSGRWPEPEAADPSVEGEFADLLGAGPGRPEPSHRGRDATVGVATARRRAGGGGGRRSAGTRASLPRGAGSRSSD